MISPTRSDERGWKRKFLPGLEYSRGVGKEILLKKTDNWWIGSLKLWLFLILFSRLIGFFVLMLNPYAYVITYAYVWFYLECTLFYMYRGRYQNIHVHLPSPAKHKQCNSRCLFVLFAVEIIIIGYSVHSLAKCLHNIPLMLLKIRPLLNNRHFVRELFRTKFAWNTSIHTYVCNSYLGILHRPLYLKHLNYQIRLRWKTPACIQLCTHVFNSLHVL